MARRELRGPASRPGWWRGARQREARQPRDLAVNAARGDDPVVDLQVVEELLHLLLFALRGQQNDEVEDPQDEGERNNLEQRVRAINQAHGEHRATSKNIMDREAGRTRSDGTLP